MTRLSGTADDCRTVSSHRDPRGAWRKISCLKIFLFNGVGISRSWLVLYVFEKLISSLIGLLEAYLLFIILGSPGFPESLGEWIMINF